MNVFIGNDIILSTLSDEAFCAYVGMSVVSNINMDYVSFNVRQIEFALCNGFLLTRRKRDSIKCGISELILSECISVLFEEKGDYFIGNSFSVDGKGSFTMIDIHDIRCIFNCDIECDKFSLVRFYIFLLSTINEVDKVGWWTINNIASQLNINTKTVMTYTSVLEELKLIYVHRPNVTIMDVNGEPKRANNTYGRYCDRGKIINCAMEYINKLNVFNGEGSLSIVDGRSISARYNSFVKGTYKGDIDALRMDCERYNAYYSRIGDGKTKDMSIFDNL